MKQVVCWAAPVHLGMGGLGQPTVSPGRDSPSLMKAQEVEKGSGCRLNSCTDLSLSIISSRGDFLPLELYIPLLSQ